MKKITIFCVLYIILILLASVFLYMKLDMPITTKQVYQSKEININNFKIEEIVNQSVGNKLKEDSLSVAHDTNEISLSYSLSDSEQLEPVTESIQQDLTKALDKPVILNQQNTTQNFKWPIIMWVSAMSALFVLLLLLFMLFTPKKRRIRSEDDVKRHLNSRYLGSI